MISNSTSKYTPIRTMETRPNGKHASLSLTQKPARTINYRPGRIAKKTTVDFWNAILFSRFGTNRIYFRVESFAHRERIWSTWTPYQQSRETKRSQSRYTKHMWAMIYLSRNLSSTWISCYFRTATNIVNLYAWTAFMCSFVIRSHAILGYIILGQYRA